jgi:hypothetical protein
MSVAPGCLQLPFGVERLHLVDDIAGVWAMRAALLPGEAVHGLLA